MKLCKTSELIVCILIVIKLASLNISGSPKNSCNLGPTFDTKGECVPEKILLPEDSLGHCPSRSLINIFSD